MTYHPPNPYERRDRDRGGRVAAPKTKKSRRNVKLTRGTVESLRGHRERQLEEKRRMGPSRQETGLVFTTTVGTPIDAGNLTYGHFRPLDNDEVEFVTIMWFDS